jgi:two-component system heavy metal sensor histidine kinase CusS
VAAFLSGRTSALLSVVAERARTADPAALDRGLEDGLELPDEVRAVATALRETLGRIRAESERAQLMTAGLAHELRSPLQNLLGEAEVALMRPRDPAEYQRVLESQVEELRDLGRSIDNLVLLCAQEEPAEQAETFDLGDEAALRLDRDSLRAGVRVELECDGDLEVRGDREALVLALRNLVGNAVTWSPPDGLVQVAITGTEREVRVTVDDQGPGIAPELGERVFEPFQRGPRAADRRVGFGLGLALARTAVVMHGGRIAAERSPAGGARVSFVLPRLPGPVAVEAPAGLAS